VPVFTTFKAMFSRQGSARVAHGPVFVFRASQLLACFIAFILDIPNGVWPLSRAVGRAYIRKTQCLPTGLPGAGGLGPD
jgi:hypothetical protein